jgi:hypothetical protein
VRVETAAEELIGPAVDVGESGELLIEVDGEPRAVHTGDVVHLRDV